MRSAFAKGWRETRRQNKLIRKLIEGERHQHRITVRSR